MKKVTTQNLKFIDNYLKKSEIDFFDIRMELTDHIASAVEDKMQTENCDFYTAFKSYMIVNKKELMQQNESLNKLNFKNIVPFLKFCLQPISLFIIFGWLFGSIYKKETIERIEGIEFFVALTFTLLLVAFVQLIVSNFFLKDRLFAVEKSGIVLMFIFYFNQFIIQFFVKDTLPFILFFIPTVIMALYIIFYGFEIRKHQKYYLK